MKPYFETNLGKLYYGDCVEVMETFKENSIDLTVTSPPYDNLRDYQGYSFNFEGIALELFRVTKEGGVVVWVVGDATIDGSETGTSFRQALYFKELGFNLHDTMIYHKDGCPFPETNRYYPAFEYMFVFSIGKPQTVNLIKDKKNLVFNQSLIGSTQREKDGRTKKISAHKVEPGRTIKEFGVRQNIWKYSPGYMKSTKDDMWDHPAVFPEKLALDHILSWSNEGDTVLDPLAGSGTTLKMAERHDRKWLGIDVSIKYCEIAAQRLKAEAEQGKLFDAI